MRNGTLHSDQLQRCHLRSYLHFYILNRVYNWLYFCDHTVNTVRRADLCKLRRLYDCFSGRRLLSEWLFVFLSSLFCRFSPPLWTLTIIRHCDAQLYNSPGSPVTFSFGVQSISFPLTLFAIQAVIVACSRLLKPSKASQRWVHDSISQLSSEHWAARETALQELIQPPEVLLQPN